MFQKNYKWVLFIHIVTQHTDLLHCFPRVEVLYGSFHPGCVLVHCTAFLTCIKPMKERMTD